MAREITGKEIQAASERLEGLVVRTPIHHWRGPETEDLFGAGTEVSLKLELFQVTGSFKPRGALTVLLNAKKEALANGIAAVSAGNHAIAAAYAAQQVGVHAKVVMIETANPFRIEQARAYGAEIVMAADAASAFDQVQEIVDSEGRFLVHPFEGPRVALGTATLGAEWCQQTDNVDAVIVPIGGGGLMAGVSAAFKLMSPDTRIIGVETEGADTMHRSFEAGTPQSIERVDTIADSLGAPMAAPYSFAACRRNVDELVKVSDRDLCKAMALLFRYAKLAVEPAAAASTAALLGPVRDELEGKRVSLMVCGSNIDSASFSTLIAEGERVLSGLPENRGDSLMERLRKASRVVRGED